MYSLFSGNCYYRELPIYLSMNLVNNYFDFILALFVHSDNIAVQMVRIHLSVSRCVRASWIRILLSSSKNIKEILIPVVWDDFVAFYL
jgi:hypothetical protein